jgi:hypothetical protein
MSVKNVVIITSSILRLKNAWGVLLTVSHVAVHQFVLFVEVAI